MGHHSAARRVFTFLLTSSALLLATTTSRAQNQPFDPLEAFNANGFDQNRDYFSSQPNESIDPMTGNLILSFTDLVLPGNAGLDLRIQRVYNSKIFRSFHDTGGRLDEDSWAGVGWTMHLGRVLSPYGFPVVEMSDGSRHPTYLEIGGSGRFMTREYWLYDKNPPQAPTLKLPNGIVYTFGVDVNGNRYVTQIADPFGNRIEIEYANPNAGEPADGIKTIRQYLTATRFRTVTFTYETGQARKNLRTITYTGERAFTWTYVHDTVGSGGPQYSLLKEVKPPVGPSWTYEYYETGNPRYELRRVTTPGGAFTEYTYSTVLFYMPGSTITVNSRAVTRKETGGFDVAPGVWTFSYAEGSNRNGSTFTTPCGQLKYRFLGIGSQVTEAWRVGLLEFKEIREGNVVLEREDFLWERGAPVSNQPFTTGTRVDAKTWVPLLDKRIVTRDGRSWTTENVYASTNFNDYGRPFQILETGERTRTTTLTYDYDFASSVYIKDKVKSETVAGGGKSLVKSYEYHDSTGFKQREVIYGIPTTFVASAQGNVAQVRDALNKTTSFTYEWGVLKDTVTPLYRILREINESGTVATVTRRGVTTSFTYDSRFRITVIDPPLGANFVYSYDDSQGRWIQLTRGDSFQKTELDGLGRVSATSNAVGVKTDAAYDSCGRISYQSYPFEGAANRGTTFTYDSLGRVKLQRHPDQARVSFDYEGLDVTITNERGFDSRQLFEAYGDPGSALLTGVIDQDGQSWSYEYDLVGNLLEVAPPGSAPKRSWVYGSSNLLAREVHPENGTVDYTYFANGKLQSRTDPEFGTTTYSYDENDRLTFVDWPGIAFTDLDYDDSDNRTLLETELHRSVFGFDGANRLTSRADLDKAGVFTLTANFAYDDRDNLQFLTYPRETGERLKIEYAYDQANRVSRIHQVGGEGEVVAQNFQYHASGGVEQYLSGNGYTYRFDYDPNRYWVRDIGELAGPEEVLELHYGYDAAGNVETIDDGRLGMDQRFTYDVLDRLDQAVGPWGTIEYGYDVQGNRTSRTGSDATTFQYSNLTNRLTSAAGSRPDSFSYDGNGNLRSTSKGVFSHTPRNMMSASSFSGVSGESATYGYDGDNLRTYKATGGATHHYFHGPGGLLLSEFETSCGEARAPVRDYVYAGSRLIVVAKNRLDPPVPISPVNATNDTTPTFEWSASSGATAYQLVVENVSSGTSVIDETGITDTHYTPSRELPAGASYRFQVRAFGSTSSCFSRASNFEIDIVPPSASSLAGSAPTPGVVRMEWLSPGDDGTTGTASSYDIRYARGTTLDFEGATEAAGEPTPLPAGTPQSFEISGLPSETTFAVAMISRDDAGNSSALSNVSVVTTLDTTPPNAVSNLQALSPTGRGVTLSWTAPSDAVSGSAVSSYDVRYSKAPLTAGNFLSASRATGIPPPASPGIVQSMAVSGLEPESTYYFAMKSVDFAGNVSLLSNVATATTLPVAVVSGTKVVHPDGPNGFREGGQVRYTIVLTNRGKVAQGDNPGDELTDALPPQLTLLSATSTSGLVSEDGNRVSWNGALSPSESVTITIEAAVNAGTAAKVISNQGTISYDSDATGTNDATALTDEPNESGANDPAVFQVLAGPLKFYTVPPCRLIDTRNPDGPLGGPALSAGNGRVFTLAGHCEIPLTARSLAVNAAVTGGTTGGFLTFHAAGTYRPLTSAVNYRAQQTKANNAVVFLNDLGQLAVYVGQPSGTVHLILDVSGYFQ